jgi:hypothetical protein
MNRNNGRIPRRLPGENRDLGISKTRQCNGRANAGREGLLENTESIDKRN